MAVIAFDFYGTLAQWHETPEIAFRTEVTTVAKAAAVL